ncbi:sugar kinase [Acrocarpospora phusangensis]|uniref:Sugar kinase n=1 Tax=Acrocarpospora phusangensis TaxID=1070424 RepID=A0A919QGD9_9ACTN|nr:carbohydrate kinase family protein [Acrocarpospora phusangensis]GIH28477.1 sugar kinase [Acrocarpospora phusangensis]
MEFDLLVVGELNADVIVECGDVRPSFGQVEEIVEDATIVLGSSGAITACGAARLGARVAMAGVVGDDWLGAFVLDRMRERGVDTRYCLRRPGRRTGMTVVLGARGDRAMLTFPGEIGRLAAADVPAAALASARHLHVSSYFLQYDLWDGLPTLLKDFPGTTSIDPGWDPSRSFDHGLPALLPQVHYLLPNEQEAERIARAAGGAPACGLVVKRGGEGATLNLPDGTALRVDAPVITPVETTGAGDSFDAGFLATLLRGGTYADALRVASACGALATRRPGGTAAQPDLAEALELANSLTVTDLQETPQ